MRWVFTQASAVEVLDLAGKYFQAGKKSLMALKIIFLLSLRMWEPNRQRKADSSCFRPGRNKDNSVLAI